MYMSSLHHFSPQNNALCACSFIPKVIQATHYTNALQRHNTENSEQMFGEKQLRGQSQFPHLCACERFKIPTNRFSYSAAGKYVALSWENT
jgi:hypothetical protein